MEKKKLKSANKKTGLLTALVANAAGEIFELDGYAAVGMAGTTQRPLTLKNTCSMPFGSELMYLPDRRPVLFNLHSGHIETVTENPYAPGQPLFPVSVFKRCPFFPMAPWDGTGANFDPPLLASTAKNDRTCG